jgi:hypothetical protein
MKPDVLSILRQAHNNGGTVRVASQRDVAPMCECVTQRWLEPIYDLTTLPARYLHHRLTDAGRDVLVQGE